MSPRKLRRAGDPPRAESTSLKYRALLTRDWLSLRWDRGDSLAEMAEEAGCCVTTVDQALRRYGVYRPRPARRSPYSWAHVLTPEFLWAAYVEQQMTMQAIAAEVGCHHGTVAEWLHKYGIPTRRAKPGVDNLLYTDVLTNEYVRARMLEGVSLNALGRVAGCTSTAAAQAARRAGVSDLVAKGRQPDAPSAPADELRRLYIEERLTMEVIAARLGVSRIKVRADLDRYGIRPYKRPPLGSRARRRREEERAALVETEVLARYERLRERWRPDHVAVLLIGPAPPSPLGHDAFFYDDGPRINSVRRCVSEALYGRVSEGEVDFERMKADGIWMIDACDRPLPKGEKKARHAVVQVREALVRRVVGLDPGGVVLCHGLVWYAAAKALRNARVRLLHDRLLPNPHQDTMAYADRLRDAFSRR